MTRPTQWTGRLSTPPTLTSNTRLSHTRAISPVKTAIDPLVGPEVLLVAHASTAEEARRIARYRSPTMSLAPRLAQTPDGDLAVFIWYLQDATSRRPRGVVFEGLLPLVPERRAPYLELAEQSHVHFALSAPDGAIHGWLELDNDFDIAGTLSTLTDRATRPASDLPAAASWVLFNVGMARLVDTAA